MPTLRRRGRQRKREVRRRLMDVLVMCMAVLVLLASLFIQRANNRRLRRRAERLHEDRMKVGRELVASLNEQTRLANELTAAHNAHTETLNKYTALQLEALRERRHEAAFERWLRYEREAHLANM